MTTLLTLMPDFSASQSWAGPMAQKTTLSNGLTLIVSERNQLPIIHLQVLIRAGAILDPPSKLGLANLVAELMTQGTKLRDATETSRQIESVGGSLSSSGELDYAGVTLSILKKDLPLGLSILSDLLMNPLFAPQEVERKVSKMKARLKQMDEEPRQVAQLAFNKKLFGIHPYAYPTEGSPETLSALTREDILRFFQTYYRPNNVTIIIVGNITLEESARYLEDLFKDWKPTSIPNAVLDQPPVLKAPVIQKIDRPISQANIIWGHLGIARSNPDFYALQIMNYILGGGGFVSRLMDTIRDNLGLTYGIYSQFNAMSFPGSFQISLETKNQNANQALLEVKKEIKRFLENGVSETELVEAKAYLTGSFPLRMDTNGKLLRLITAIELYGLGLDFPEKYPGLINQISAEEVLRVARTYLHPEQFLLVVVGNQKEIQLKDSWE